MRILWLSNIFVSEIKPNSTGTWISSMLKEIIKTADITICNISSGNEKSIKRIDFENIEQWIIPTCKLNKHGLPSKKIQDGINNIINNFNPDVIHIWGVESYWGLLKFDKCFNEKTLLEIQGFKGIYSKVFYGGLKLTEIISTIGIIEIIFPNALLYKIKNNYSRWGKFEELIIANHKFINTQSDWVRDHINTIVNDSKLFHTGIILREEIINAKSWLNNNRNQILTVTSNIPYKGLHITIRAFAIVKRNFPQMKLAVAGVKINKKNYLNPGYLKYIINLSKRLNVYDSIIWLGNLTADELVEEYHKSSVFVLSSFIETYCLALAEALYVGMPSVVAYSSALPELAVDNVSSLYYPPGEYVICASKIEKILTHDELALSLSRNAREQAIIRNNSSQIVDNQIRIYKNIINNNNNNINYSLNSHINANKKH